MLSLHEIESLDEDSAERLHLELCDEASKTADEAFRVYKHLRVLRRKKELKMGLVDTIVPEAKPEHKPREKTPLENLVLAANEKGLDLLSLLNE